MFPTLIQGGYRVALDSQVALKMFVTTILIYPVEQFAIVISFIAAAPPSTSIMLS